MNAHLFSPRSYSNEFLLTIHGLGSENEGLAHVRTACEDRLAGLLCDSYYYGKKCPLMWPFRGVDASIFKHVKEKIEIVYLKHIIKYGRRLFIIAHSFGTHAVMQALEMHVAEVRIPGIRIEGLVLLGSVVRRDYPWDELIDKGVLRHPPLAVVRPHDRVVRGAKWVGGGPSGAEGFISTGRYRPMQTFKNGGHVSYYPADCDDIVTVIRSGIGSVPLVSYNQWRENCGVLKSVSHRLW